MGLVDAAADLYRRLIEQHPTALELYLPYIASLSASPLESTQWLAELQRMHEVAEAVGLGLGAEAGAAAALPGADTSRFLEAMARAAERAGRLDEAWAHQTLSNQLQLRRYSRGTAARNADVDKEDDGSVWPFPMSPWGGTMRQQRIEPLFVVGLPNSGVEELISLLDCRREIVGMAARPEYFRHLALVSDHGFRYGAFELYRPHAKRLAAQALAGRGDPLRHTDQVEKFRQDITDTYTVLAQHAVGSGAKAGGPGLNEVRFVVDHAAANFAYLREPLSLFPRSIALHTVRDDPVDALLMNYRHPQFGKIGVNVGASLWAYDLNSSADRLRTHDRFMRRWREECAREFGQADCPRIVEIRYSDLVQRPEEVLRAVAEALGLPTRPGAEACPAAEAQPPLSGRDFGQRALREAEQQMRRS